MSVLDQNGGADTATLRSYVREKRILVCCGAGGVGKTTTSAALALAAARDGRRVLVLTIDPSKRLAETLGIAPHSPEPVRLDPELERACGIAAPGALSAWMLDPKKVSDDVVRRIIGDEQEAQRLIDNRIYAQITQLIAGMQEYTAVEALHSFLETGRYDVVVLDTPPSRNALSFLDAPRRLNTFLEGRIFQLFIPKEGGFMRGAATRLISKVFGTVFGEGPFAELSQFFGAFRGIFQVLNRNAQELRAKLRQPDVTFLLVTSPAREAINDAVFFQSKIRDLELPLGGFVLNRSHATRATIPAPGPELLPPNPGPHHLSALEKLQQLGRRERLRVEADLDVLADLRERTEDCSVPVVAVPDFPAGVDDLDALVELAELLTASGDPDPEIAAAVPNSIARPATIGS